MKNQFLEDLRRIHGRSDLTRDVIGQAAIAQSIENLASAVEKAFAEDEDEDDYFI